MASWPIFADASFDLTRIAPGLGKSANFREPNGDPRAYDLGLGCGGRDAAGKVMTKTFATAEISVLP